MKGVTKNLAKLGILNWTIKHPPIKSISEVGTQAEPRVWWAEMLRWSAGLV